MDEPTEFPDGTEIELVAVSGLDELDDEERAELRGPSGGEANTGATAQDEPGIAMAYPTACS
jgi:hypothetical protein